MIKNIDEMSKEEKKNYAIELVLSGKTTVEIAEIFGYTKDGMKSFFQRNKIKLTELKGLNIVKKFFNIECLKDNELMMYFLGLVASDGTIDNDRPRIRITLHKKDKDILDKLKERMFINHNEIEHYINREDYLDFHVQNKELYEFVLNYGLTPSKTKTLNIKYDIMSSDGIRHFIRGYFDGDGSISSTQKKYTRKDGSITYGKYYLDCRIIGNEGTMNSFHNIIGQNNIENSLTDITMEKYSFPFFEVRMYTDSCLKFYNYIYNNSTIFLKRKKDIFDTYVASSGESR